jgi:hypothetical protein
MKKRDHVYRNELAYSRDIINLIRRIKSRTIDE